MTYTFTIDSDLPVLHIPAPSCEHCSNDVQIDGDTAWCETCLVKWETIGESAAVVDPDQTAADGTACGVESQVKTRLPYDYDGKHWSFGDYQSCILPTGHEGEHRHPIECTSTVLR